MKIIETLRFISWVEYGERAYALVDSDYYFGTALNLYRGGDMGEKDENGIYSRKWGGDCANTCDNFEESVRVMTRAEVKTYLQYVKLRDDDILVFSGDTAVVLRTCESLHDMRVW